MVFSDFHFYSDVLEIETAAYVLMPDEKVIRQSSEPVPVLYLLHGLSGDHTTWMRQTSIERYARRYRVCVVMPAANKSYYMDMAYGAKYDTFIGEELPAIIERCIPFVSKKREGRFAAGLSMGGYGAMKLGLSRPGRYAAVASLSGALGIDHIYDERGKRPASYFQMMDLIFDGEKNLCKGKGYLTRYARKLAKTPEKCPKLYVACGTEDQLFEANNRFVQENQDHLPLEYHTSPGIHNWDFWDEYIEKVLEWLPLEKAQA